MHPIHDHFQENLLLLKRHHPQAYQMVMDFKGPPTGALRPAGNGKPNLWICSENGRETSLHDAGDPEAELTGYHAMVPEDANGIVICLGMGLGYIPLSMVKSRPKVRHIAVFELETGILLQALRAMDLAPLLSDKRLILHVGPVSDVAQALAPMGRTMALENLQMLNHLPSVNLNPTAYKILHDEIYKLANTINVGGMTTRTFGRKFAENRLKHISAIHHQRLLEHLKDAFAGLPAIIVASGPSLNKNIHLLPRAAGHAVIIGVDTVLPALLAHGVTPDFVTTIDMQDIVIEKIVDVAPAAEGTSLVCASWVSPMIPKNFPARQVYWTFAAKHMEMWLNELLGGVLLTSGAGTVAHLSYTTAVLLGCSPVIFVGQDLAFTDEQDHARHTSLTTKNELEGFYKRNEILWVDGFGGGKVPTVRGWLSDKHHFERLMGADTHRKFVNATEGGVRLEGTEELTLEEALNRYCPQEIDIPKAIRAAEEKNRMAEPAPMIHEFERQLKTMAGIEKDMQRMESVCAKLDREIKRLRKQGGKQSHFDLLPPQVKKQIHESDELNSRLDKARIWKLLDEVTMEGLHQSERLNHEIMNVEGKPEHYLEWLEKNIQRFDLINRCRRDVLAFFQQQLKNLSARLKRESALLQKIGSPPTPNPDRLFELLRLYYEEGDNIQLAKTIAAHCPDGNDSAELCFYLGAAAAFQSQFHRAEQYWSRAMELDQAWSPSIGQCRRRLGDQYLAFNREWERNDRDVARRMLFKGLRHCPDHPEIGNILAKQVSELLAQAELALENGKPAGQADDFKPWCSQMDVDHGLAQVLGADQAAALYRHYGCALVSVKDYLPATEAFTAAVTLTPDNPALYLSLADIAFTTGNKAQGLVFLDKAVSLDRRYGEFWENMGDNLMRSNQPQDAVAAYERCLLALPERVILLKKIGDCYMALDQPEAALEAYKFYKAKIETTPITTDKTEPGRGFGHESVGC